MILLIIYLGNEKVKLNLVIYGNKWFLKMCGIVCLEFKF